MRWPSRFAHSYIVTGLVASLILLAGLMVRYSVGLWAEPVTGSAPGQSGWLGLIGASAPVLIPYINTFFELAGAAVCFFLVRKWLHVSDPVIRDPANWRPLIAAALYWLNPAGIISAHVIHSFDVAVAAFYLAAIFAILHQRWLTAGIVLGVGTLFIHQTFIAVPIVFFWPFLQRNWIPLLRYTGGLLIAGGVWLFGGKLGVPAEPITMFHGFANNFPSILAVRFGFSDPTLTWFTIHPQSIGNWPDAPLPMPVGTGLILLTILGLLLSTILIVLHNAHLSRKLLVALVLPWLVYFSFALNVHERFLVYAVLVSVVMAPLGFGALLLHLAITAIACVQMLHLLLADPTYSGLTWGLAPETAGNWLKIIAPTFPDLGWTLLMLTGVYFSIAAKITSGRVKLPQNSSVHPRQV